MTCFIFIESYPGHKLIKIKGKDLFRTRLQEILYISIRVKNTTVAHVRVMCDIHDQFNEKFLLLTNVFRSLTPMTKTK